MTMRLVEGFDHETSNTDFNNGRGTLASSGVSFVTGRFSGRAIRSVTGGAMYNSPNFTAMTTGFLGLAGQSGSSQVQVLDSTTVQVGFTFNTTTGVLNAYRGGTVGSPTTGTLIGTTTVGSPPGGAWYFIELGSTIDPSAGTFQVRLNGSTILNLTGINTRTSANSSFNNVALSQFSTGTQVLYDDFHVNDNLGSLNNTYLGDTRVYTSYPNANSSVTWTPLAGTNWQEVSEAQMDSDTSYNSTATAGNQDTFTIGSLPGTPSAVYAAQVTGAYRKDDAGASSVANILVSGGTTATGASVAASASYVYQADLYETDPNTSAAWTSAGINAAKIGYNKTV